MDDDFKRAKAILNANVLATCRRYLRRGTVVGDWWLVSTPWRVDKNPSLTVNLKSGRWVDLARREDRGDLIDLIAKVTGKAQVEVVNEVLGK